MDRIDQIEAIIDDLKEQGEVVEIPENEKQRFARIIDAIDSISEDENDPEMKYIDGFFQGSVLSYKVFAIAHPSALTAIFAAGVAYGRKNPTYQP